MPDNVCPHCKSPNRNSARYCAECGTPLLGGLPPAEERPAGAADPAADDMITGKILVGRYRMDYALGRGGFGAVYKGYDMNVSRPCAIKENLEVSLDAQRQFAREASVLANLSHPNLPRVTDHFSIPGQAQYLVMDFVEGEDLASIVARQHIIPYRQAAEWILQVADALEYLHTQQPPVLHRDVKPANIRINSRGKPYLVDFGLVKLNAPGSETTLGARAVTPGYAPPEQYGRGKTDGRTDIYALGATLYNILTGEEPLESVQRVTGASHPTTHQRNPEVPIALSQVVERAMALDPQARFQTMADLRRGLRVALQEADQSSPVQTVANIDSFEAPTAIGLTPDPALKKVNLRSSSASQVQPEAAPGTAPQEVISRPASGPKPAGAGNPAAGEPVSRPRSQPLPAERSGRRLGPVLIGIVVVLGLCLGGMYLAARIAGGASATSATATAQAQATLAAQVNATASAQAAIIHANQTAQAGGEAQAPGSPAAVLEPIPGLPDWPVKAQDDFSSNSNGWWVGRDNSAEVFNVLEVQIQDGMHRATLDPKAAGDLWWNQSPVFQTGENFILSVDSRQTSGPGDAWRGLIFRQVDNQNFFLFAIADQGKYGIWRYEQAQWNEVAQGDAASIQAGETNHLTVFGQGQEFTFYINGQEAAKQTLSAFASGAAGLYFETVSAEPISFETDNLFLQAP